MFLTSIIVVHLLFGYVESDDPGPQWRHCPACLDEKFLEFHGIIDDFELKGLDSHLKPCEQNKTYVVSCEHSCLQAEVINMTYGRMGYYRYCSTGVLFGYDFYGNSYYSYDKNMRITEVVSKPYSRYEIYFCNDPECFGIKIDIPGEVSGSNGVPVQLFYRTALWFCLFFWIFMLFAIRSYWLYPLLNYIRNTIIRYNRSRLISSVEGTPDQERPNSIEMVATGTPNDVMTVEHEKVVEEDPESLRLETICTPTQDDILSTGGNFDHSEHYRGGSEDGIDRVDLSSIEASSYTSSTTSLHIDPLIIGDELPISHAARLHRSRSALMAWEQRTIREEDEDELLNSVEDAEVNESEDSQQNNMD